MSRPMSANVSFLLELRKRLLRLLGVWVLIAGVCLFFANDIYAQLAYPLIHQLVGAKVHLIAIGVSAPLMVPMQSALMVSVYLVLPVILFEFWQFIHPALYRHEKTMLTVFLLLGTTLFYGGTVFAYWVVLPAMFHFFSAFSPVGVSYSPDISAYLDFISGVFLSFGIVFLLPIVIVSLHWLGVVDRFTFVRYRPYVIVGCFIVGMVLTPPDVVSQCCMAIPMWGLFELGLLLCRWISQKKICKVSF